LSCLIEREREKKEGGGGGKPSIKREKKNGIQKYVDQANINKFIKDKFAIYKLTNVYSI
jgi:hypothetical protein